MTDTVSEKVSATHTAPSPVAIPVADPMPPGLASSVLEPGSMRDRVWSSKFTAHTAPSPNAIPEGRCPTGTPFVTAFRAGSITATVFGPVGNTAVPPPRLSRTATTTPTSTAAPVAIQASGLRRRAPRTPIGGDSIACSPVPPPSTALAAAARSPALAYRFSGFLARARSMTSSIPSGSSGRRAVTRGGDSSRCAYRTVTSWSRANGGSPVRHSNSRHPSEYTSVRPSTGSPRICSGDT
jgi:hypothetical protein